MAPAFRRSLGWFPLLTIAAALPAAWLVSNASAEERKFVVILADMPKDRPGPATGPGAVITLPNRNEVWDAYFDKTKNGQNGTVRVDSFAEWWEEVSYGDVTVSGDAYGWVQLPWKTTPPGGGNVAPHIDLQGGLDYNPGIGEGFDNTLKFLKYDKDGVGTNLFLGNNRPLDEPGSNSMDQFMAPFWSPGERFLDVNDNGVYDAGVAEYGIDKNGNGRIDGPSAASFTELFQVTTYPPVPEQQAQAANPPNPALPACAAITTYSLALTGGNAISWASTAEWFDSNGDGKWNIAGVPDAQLRQFTIQMPTAPQRTAPIDVHGPTCKPQPTNRPVKVFRGDWGGREIWAPISPFGVGQPAQIPAGSGQLLATIFDFLIQRFPPAIANQQQPTVDWLDEQGNMNYDFPEPFEDFMRRWDADAGDWNPVDNAYVDNNWPGTNINTLKDFDLMTNPTGRTKNHLYDGPDKWNNSGPNSTAKIQPIVQTLLDVDEQAEQQLAHGATTPEPAWYQDWWIDRYASPPPPWTPEIPYMRVFNPTIATPPSGANPEPPQPMKFEPNRGGPYGDGTNFGGVPFALTMGHVRPDPIIDGFYDGNAEYDDLPSSIYHSGGDQCFGEVTGPQGNHIWGEDIGGATPTSPDADGIITAAGPVAFNVHGDGGYDAGNQLKVESLTWQNMGLSNSDIPIPGPGGTVVGMIYHRDTNLDGNIDLGEVPMVPGKFGIPNDKNTAYVPNYGADVKPGGRPDGNPDNDYPFNRQRACEDAVEALDDLVRWDNYLGGPPPFGELISGVLFVSDRSNGRMFRLPAASFDLAIRTRDRIDGGEPDTLAAHYQPLTFFNGLGITISSYGNATTGQAIEGDAAERQPVNTYQMPWACHEYGHSWQGFPDLYDYDVYRDFDSPIINNPIGRWCIMAGGGAIHPVPILKQDSGWITAVDITKALTPAGISTLDFRPWEFDRNKTVFYYSNALFPGEEFWFWRTAPSDLKGGTNQLTFDRNMPANGLTIMHVDRSADPEGVPSQQRIGSHFTYNIIQADGLQQLDTGENTGDTGDVFPGSTNNKVWNRDTDPSNRWYGGQGCGLSILDITPLGNLSRVTIRWTPQELPSLEWVQPPGGISVNGVYQLRYFAYDQFGGTQIQFFALRNLPGVPLNYEDGIPVGVANKFPGEVDGVFAVNIPNVLLPDGTYSFYAKLNPGLGADGRMENSWSKPRGNINNRGNGDLTVNAIDLAVSKLEAWTVVCVNPTPVGSETWSVTGTVTGAQQAQAVTGQPYNADAQTLQDNSQHIPLNFTINNGSIPFRAGDSFSFLTTGFTAHSAAVLVQNLEVVQPQPPIAAARIESGSATGLAPLQIVFKHDGSSDPRGAALTFRWDFGDGSDPVTTDRIDQPIVHTYTVPSPTPYVATLTVSNSFGLSTTATININVREALPPTVRAAVDPTTGPKPLPVRFTGSLTTDPNPGTLSLDYVWDFGDGSAPVFAANVDHTYDNTGIFRATLTVTNRPFGKSASKSVEIRVTGPPANQRPTARIAASRRFGPAPLEVDFNGAESTDPENGTLAYTWNFGDGSAVVRGTANVRHTFTRAGTYNVQLTTTDNSDQSDTATLAIVVTSDAAGGNSAPVSSIVTTGTQGAAPFTVTFDGTASVDPDGGAITYVWDFGDGSTKSTEPKVAHTYTQARDYTAVLTVTDANGASGASSVKISVTLPSGGTDSGAGQPDTGTDNPITEVTGCGQGCGPIGLMPLALTLASIGGLRRYGRRLMR